jgi:hypothetical protein
MLALSFLLLIGMSLVAEGLGFHIPKGYIYFAMAFSVLVEVLNIQFRRKASPPVKLRNTPAGTGQGSGLIVLNVALGLVAAHVAAKAHGQWRQPIRSNSRVAEELLREDHEAAFVVVVLTFD